MARFSDRSNQIRCLLARRRAIWGITAVVLCGLGLLRDCLWQLPQQGGTNAATLVPRKSIPNTTNGRSGQVGEARIEETVAEDNAKLVALPATALADLSQSLLPTPSLAAPTTVDSPSEVIGDDVPNRATFGKHRRLLLGKWEQFYHGRRILTVCDDGTAQLVVEPNGVWAYLVGERLTIDISWQLDNGRLRITSTGVTPEDKMSLVGKMWGTHHDQKILELTDNRLLTLGKDGVTEYDWKRADAINN